MGVLAGIHPEPTAIRQVVLDSGFDLSQLWLACLAPNTFPLFRHLKPLEQPNDRSPLREPCDHSPSLHFSRVGLCPFHRTWLRLPLGSYRPLIALGSPPLSPKILSSNLPSDPSGISWYLPFGSIMGIPLNSPFSLID